MSIDQMLECMLCGYKGTQRDITVHTCNRPWEAFPKIQVKFKKLHPDAKAPERKTDGAAGWDLRGIEARLEGQEHGCVWRITTGIAVEIPPGYVGQVSIRSSLGRTGLSIPNAPGIIDSDYRGEIIIMLQSILPYLSLNPKDRIAQLVIHKLPDVEFVEVESLGETARGSGSFGSTGR
jgi:dUTP pyrophosphatase